MGANRKSKKVGFRGRREEEGEGAKKGSPTLPNKETLGQEISSTSSSWMAEADTLWEVGQGLSMGRLGRIWVQAEKTEVNPRAPAVLQ